jgi:hypothetical protein
MARAGIKVVICLLNDAEMRTLGMNGYHDCMKECGISGMSLRSVCFCAALEPFGSTAFVLRDPFSAPLRSDSTSHRRGRTTVFDGSL